MAIYIGFYRYWEEWLRELAPKVRGGQTVAEAFEAQTAKTRELPQTLPEGCKLIGSYAPTGIGAGDPGWERFPGVMIVETDDPAHLGVIVRHYAGLLSFAFHPYNPVART